MGNATVVDHACSHEQLAKRGKNRNGTQRWKCCQCGQSVTRNDHKRPLGDMRIDLDDAVTVLRMLLEGMSIRACERMTGMNRDTICDLVLNVGQSCDQFLATQVRNVQSAAIEMDEIWSFVLAKDKTAKFKNLGEGTGDSWTWFAIDADSKMILSHAVGLRDEPTCRRFLTRLNNATTGQVQVTSDGLALYTHNVPMHLGSRVDFAQLIKTYKTSQAETRYSPATITGIEKTPRFGTPDEDRISTSYSERFNLSVRMHVRRFTRLTNAHSKSAEHHAAMVALFTAYYNFCRKHETLGKATPAMASELTDRVWSVRELLTAIAA
jgi:transposase-like protein/IS1 family transposase